MSWDCPYLKHDGSCELRHQDCKPLEKGCIILTSDKYKRLYKKDDNQKPSMFDEREPQAVILQHVPNENAGTILAFLEEMKMPCVTVRLYEKNYVFPDLASIRSVVVMGGPMNVYEEDKYPFLREENNFIKEIVKNNIPYLGVCLGAQLLAKALGAKVYKGKKPEIGWDTVDFTDEASACKIFQGFGQTKSLKILQWHEDTFDLPQGSVHLASSRIVPNQAFCYKNLFYGLQFHVEVDRSILEDWFKDSERLGDIVREHDSYRTELEKITRRIYISFFEIRKKALDHWLEAGTAG